MENTDLMKKKIERAVGHYLCEDGEYSLYEAYNVLLEVDGDGDGNTSADDYVSVWEPLASLTVKELINLIHAELELIEAHIEPYSHIPDFFKNIDWELLRRQKISLDSVSVFHSDSEIIYNNLQGILELIDALQDYAVDVLGVDENKVFKNDGYDEGYNITE